MDVLMRFCSSVQVDAYGPSTRMVVFVAKDESRLEVTGNSVDEMTAKMFKVLEAAYGDEFMKLASRVRGGPQKLEG
jgi:hypothetical protein